MRKTREYETRLMKVLNAANAKVIDRRVDGAGHIKLTFVCRGTTRKFHFPQTGATRGCNLLNHISRLKQIIARIPTVEKQMDESASPTHGKSY